MLLSILFRHCFAAIVILLILSGCFFPILSKPTIEPSSLPHLPTLPENITHLPGTLNKSISPGMCQVKTSWLDVGDPPITQDGYMDCPLPRWSYFFELYCDHASAKSQYEYIKNLYGRVFKETENNGWIYYLTYVEQARDDIEGLHMPRQRWSSGAYFLSGNLIISVSVTDNNSSSTALALAVKQLAELLSREFRTSPTKQNNTKD